eukprot:6208221-Amphidinium_carterae.1
MEELSDAVAAVRTQLETLQTTESGEPLGLVENLESKCIHRIRVGSVETEWRTNCGWRFGRHGVRRLLSSVGEAPKRCEKCFPGESAESAAR